MPDVRERADQFVRSPVFVDSSGHRRRMVKRALGMVAVVCLGYLLLLGFSFVGGPVTPGDLLALPGSLGDWRHEKVDTTSEQGRSPGAPAVPGGAGSSASAKHWSVPTQPAGGTLAGGSTTGVRGAAANTQGATDGRTSSGSSASAQPSSAAAWTTAPPSGPANSATGAPATGAPSAPQPSASAPGSAGSAAENKPAKGAAKSTSGKKKPGRVAGAKTGRAHLPEPVSSAASTSASDAAATSPKKVGAPVTDRG